MVNIKEMEENTAMIGEQDMIINSGNSQKIAETIGKILNKNVNIMNEEGVIVASTDPNRIFTFHQGAKDLIEKDVPELDIYSDDKVTGAKEGINLPIVINGHTRGVIGVTGSPDKLRDISLVIGEMANIFFRQTELSDNKNWELRQKRYFWEELIFTEHLIKNKEFVRRGKELGIQIEQVRSVAQLYLPLDEMSPNSSQSDARIISVLYRHLDVHILLSHHRIGDRLVLLLAKEVTAKMKHILTTCLLEIREQLGLTVYCGISGGCKSYTQIHKVYLQAEDSLEVAIQGGIPQVCSYAELILDILLCHVSRENKDEFLKYVWGDVEREERIQLIEFLKVFYKYNGSISKISEDLFIHKNTVQYRIKKIQELTGYDPRKISESTILNICLHMEK